MISKFAIYSGGSGTESFKRGCRVVFASWLLPLIFLPTHAYASAIYKCTAENGAVSYSDTPCLGATATTQSTLRAPQSGSFENSEYYKSFFDYPEKWRTPELLNSHRQAWKAEQAVRAQRAVKGGTVGDYLDNLASKPVVVHSDWVARPGNSGAFSIEFLAKLSTLSSPTIYRWSVTPSGQVTPLNGHAIGITERR